MMVKTLIRTVLSLLAGLVAGAVLNGLIIQAGPHIIPPPEGTDPTDLESLKKHIQMFEARHFLFPFLAHALGTCAGAFVASLLAGRERLWPALVVGIAFLAGGVINVVLLPAPVWFSALDLILAYLPMAWVGYRLAGKVKPGAP